MGNRWIRCGLLVVIAIVLVLVFFAINPFGKSDENEPEIVNFTGVSTENGTRDGSVDVPSSDEDEQTSLPATVTVIMFHNGTGPMCIEALEFFEEHEVSVEEHLTTDEDFSSELDEYMKEYNGVSEGVSDSFGYYPVIFIGGRAFSGFDGEVGQAILELGGWVL